MLIPLLYRGLIRVEGEDRVSFLQGLLTQDISPTDHEPYARYSGALNAQGRLLFDMIVVSWQGVLWLDMDASCIEACTDHLRRYRLRQRVEIIPCDPLQHSMGVWIEENKPDWPQSPGQTMPLETKGLIYRDPRHAPLGWRFIRDRHIMPQETPVHEPWSSEDAYQALRIRLGIPESPDWDAEKSTPLEIGLGDLNAISWDKGCYVGQELTARTRYRGVIRKRLFPVSFDGGIPTDHASILLEGEDVGHMRSISPCGDRGIAMLRLEAFQACIQDQKPLWAGSSIRVIPCQPDWMHLEREEGF